MFCECGLSATSLLRDARGKKKQARYDTFESSRMLVGCLVGRRRKVEKRGEGRNKRNKRNKRKARGQDIITEGKEEGTPKEQRKNGGLGKLAWKEEYALN